MAVARISMGRAVTGEEKKLAEAYDELDRWLSQQPGFIMAFRLASHDDPRELGRIGIWESAEVTNRAANLNHTVVLRSQVHLLLEPGHTERIYDIHAAIPELPKPRAASRGNKG